MITNHSASIPTDIFLRKEAHTMGSVLINTLSPMLMMFACMIVGFVLNKKNGVPTTPHWFFPNWRPTLWRRL